MSTPSKAEQRRELVAEKVAAGLTREQAEQVVAAQEDWDAEQAANARAAAQAESG